MGFEKKVLTGLLLSVMATAIGASPNISEQELIDAREQAREAMGRVGKVSEMPKPMMDLSKIPAPLVKYNGNMLDSAMTSGGFKQNDLEQSMPAKNKIIVFVSFSMPEESIRRYVTQANLLGREKVSLAIIGMDESNNLQKFSARVSSMTKDSNVEFNIDPNVFERFGINQVPAIVVYREDPLYEAQCAMRGEAPKEKEDFLSVYGDTTIDYALEH
ncbi:MAG: type-F conjugative transfer system pilin assembly protein TrbC, partial [Thiotrichales bacterium]|nr:type-F conjugative transfer system pilin assembly protein TrbC [Thiotrichales bacterium]